MRGNRSLVLRLLAVLFSFALIAAACGDDDDAGDDGGDAAADSSGGDAADDGAADDGAADDGAADDGTADDGTEATGGTFRYGYNVQLTNLDPHLSTIAQDATWLYPVYDRLVHVTPAGDLVPGLAEAWELSDDGLTLTLTLRQGVTFHDGAAFDAEAAKASLERAKSLEESEPATLLAPVESIEVVDPFTLQLNLSAPYASLLGVLSDRTGMMISPDALSSGVDLSSEAVGAGPFRFSSFQLGDRAVYTAFEDYWDPDAVRIDQLEIVDMLDDTTRLNALLDGQLDAARILSDGIESAEGAGLVVDQSPTLEVWWLILNHNIGDLSNPKVRQAMASAIDKQAIIDVLWDGAAVEVNQMFPPEYYATDPDSTGLWSYDPDAALALMEESGSTGFDLPVVYTAAPTYDALIAVVQQQLEPLGINIQAEGLQVSDAVGKWFANEAGILFGPWSGRPDPYTTLQSAYSEASTFANAVAKTRTPEIEDLLVQIEASSGEEREGLIREVNAIAAELQLHIPLFAPNYINAMSDSVSGLDIYVTSKPEFRGVSVAN